MKHDGSRHQDSPSGLYRPCVGLCVFNPSGEVFVGRRGGGTDQVDQTHSWQLPQGGIDAGEEPYAAALRELYEETSIRSVTHLAEVEQWLSYDLPGAVAGHFWKGRFRGQTQKWFALRFTGAESEINVTAPGGGVHKPEFIEWRWVALEQVTDLVIPFKRDVYAEVVRQFNGFARPA